MKKIFILVILMVKLINPHTYRFCPDCDVTTLRDTIAVADSGDVIVLPADTCTWKDTLRIIKAVEIRGSGSATVIYDSTEQTWGNSAIQLSAGKDNFVRISGIRFKGDGGGFGTIWARDTLTGFRVDHCIFDTIDGGRAIYIDAIYNIGVIDHCHSNGDINDGITFATIMENNDEFAWSRSLSFGTDSATYIEDNYMYASATSSSSGARCVARYNQNYEGKFDWHGTCASNEYGSFSGECYKNKLVTASSYSNGILIRGGTHVVWGNEFTGEYTPSIRTYSRRSCIDDGSPACDETWDRCDGDSEFDGNWDATGWPCAGQLSVIGPVDSWDTTSSYLWDNTDDGSAILLDVYNFGECDNPSVGDHIQEGREYHDTTEHPTYTPYTYPHPLAIQTWYKDSAYAVGADSFAVICSIYRDTGTIYLQTKAPEGSWSTVDSAVSQVKGNKDTLYSKNLSSSTSYNVRLMFYGLDYASAIRDTIDHDGFYNGWNGWQVLTAAGYKHDSNTHRILDTTLGIIRISTWPSKVYVDTSSDDETWGVYDSTQGVADFIDTIAPVSGKYHRTRATTYKVVE